jgi:hypothetical protein
MQKTQSYENFPLWIILLSNFVALSIYALGAYILAGFGIWPAVLYLLYCLWLEFRLWKEGCVNCYYYGKFCGFGKGKLCSLFFKKGDPQKFVEKQFSWTDMLPDFIVPILPLVGGIVLLIINFNWPLLVMLAALIILYFSGNAVIRGSFTCKYCRQKEIGCPALELFGGKKT